MQMTRELDSEISTEAHARWSLVERVAAGASLQRSARLRLLLQHVGRHSVFENAAPLHEMEIGTVVFGRPAQYDTSQDNIVRVNFSELRKRIQQYFSTEGKNENVQFDIPRGSYELRFFLKPQDAFDQMFAEDSARIPPITSPEPVAAEAAPTAPRPGVKRLLFTCYVLAGAVICLAVCSCVLWWRAAHPVKTQEAGWTAGPELKQFWQPFLGGAEPVDIVLADNSLALAQDLTGQDLALSDYISYNYQPLHNAEIARHQQPGGVKLLLARNMGSFGDFKVASMVQALAPASRSNIVSARGYSAASVRDHNSILLGSRRSNPWVELIEKQLQYRFQTSPDRRETAITVLHPRSGEQAQYVSVSDPSTQVSFAVIAVLPSPGAGAHTLLIAGTDSRATLAAGELLTNERKLRVLSHALNGRPMDHMQVLLRAETMRDTPLDAQILSVRTDF